MRVILSRSATTFLQRETRYLKSRNPAAAAKFVSLFRNARHRLSLFPEIGPKELHLPIPGSRTLVVGDYLLDYSCIDDQIIVFNIRHGRMRLLPIDNDGVDTNQDE